MGLLPRPAAGALRRPPDGRRTELSLRRVRLALAPLLLAASVASAADAGARPRNVVLVIGDGMGLSHLTAGLVAAGGRLAVERFPVVGLAKTAASDRLVTDSAAAATAMACGVKTYNGAIGVDAGGRPVPSLLERARARGLKTGVVVTSSLTDATPAAFLAHRPSRKQQEEIAIDVAAFGTDVLAGGGRRFFATRSDGRDLLAELSARGHTVVATGEALAAAPPGKVAAFLAEEGLPAAEERGDTLPSAVSAALARLSGGAGFVLVVEGAQVDWAAHAGDGNRVAAEVADLDRTVARVLDFAAKDGRTLVVLTSDHETGGLAVTGGSVEERTIETGFVTKGHTATMVPVFAFGPGAGAFAGVYENSGVGERLRAALGL